MCGEVCADPAAALAKYQPNWYFPMHGGSSRRALNRSAADNDEW